MNFNERQSRTEDIDGIDESDFTRNDNISDEILQQILKQAQRQGLGAKISEFVDSMDREGILTSENGQQNKKSTSNVSKTAVTPSDQLSFRSMQELDSSSRIQGPPKFDGTESFKIFERKIEANFKARKLWGFITNQYIMPENTEDKEIYLHRRDVAYSDLMNCIPNKYDNLITGHFKGDPKSLWDVLKENCEISKKTQIGALYEKIFAIKLKRNINILEMIREFDSIFFQFSALGSNVDDEQKLYYFRKTLLATHQYEDIVNSTAGNKTLTYNDLKEAMKEKYHLLKSINNEEHDEEYNVKVHRAQSRGGNNSRRGGYRGNRVSNYSRNNNNSYRNENINDRNIRNSQYGNGNNVGDKNKRFDGNCNYCSKYGHKWADCYTRINNLNNKHNSNSNNNGNGNNNKHNNTNNNNNNHANSAAVHQNNENNNDNNNITPTYFKALAATVRLDSPTSRH